MQEGRENQNEVVLEFDLNTLADEKCRALEAYVKRCQSQTKKAPAKAVPNKAIKTQAPPGPTASTQMRKMQHYPMSYTESDHAAHFGQLVDYQSLVAAP
jgi:hypothetical protein